MSIFRDEVAYQRDLSRGKWKHKVRGLRKIMTPTEVIQRVKKAGVDEISESSLRRYAREGLIQKPVVKSAGRTKGRIADHPPDNFAEYIASFKMKHLHKLTSPVLSKFRKTALNFDNHEFDPEFFLEKREALLEAIAQSTANTSVKFERVRKTYNLETGEQSVNVSLRNQFQGPVEEALRLVHLDDIDLMQELVSARRWLKYKEEELGRT